MAVGLLHPGEMGAAIGGRLCVPVLWASEGRSAETRRRAAAFEDAGTVAEVARRSDVILSVCPPHAARAVARGAAGFGGIYVDANAVAPASARELAELFPRFVDGGIVGPPPGEGRSTRLYLSGREAASVAALFAGSGVDARGSVGADDPVLAVEDALREFGADEVVLAGDADLLSAARERVAVPVSLLG